jgi:multidrug efflux pump
MVEFANHLQETGLSKLEAIIGGASTRLRPILMTTAATVFGHFPLVLATGPGAGARNSIGIMLVSGMIIGTNGKTARNRDPLKGKNSVTR